MFNLVFRCLSPKTKFHLVFPKTKFHLVFPLRPFLTRIDHVSPLSFSSFFLQHAAVHSLGFCFCSNLFTKAASSSSDRLGQGRKQNYRVYLNLFKNRTQGGPDTFFTSKLSLSRVNFVFHANFTLVDFEVIHKVMRKSLFVEVFL